MKWINFYEHLMYENLIQNNNIYHGFFWFTDRHIKIERFSAKTIRILTANERTAKGRTIKSIL